MNWLISGPATFINTTKSKPHNITIRMVGMKYAAAASPQPHWCTALPAVTCRNLAYRPSTNRMGEVCGFCFSLRVRGDLQEGLLGWRGKDFLPDRQGSLGNWIIRVARHRCRGWIIHGCIPLFAAGHIAWVARLLLVLLLLFSCLEVCVCDMKGVNAYTQITLRYLVGRETSTDERHFTQTGNCLGYIPYRYP